MSGYVGDPSIVEASTMGRGQGWGVELNEAVAELDRWYGEKAPHMPDDLREELRQKVQRLIFAAQRMTGFVAQDT